MSIPALIVSGYLGSGKTTLVGHLLAEAQKRGIRLAIISNEFGDTGIDRALLDAGSEGFVELDGGCVCCRLSDALSETVELIVQQARPDRLVLETSGVALPGEILIQFWRPPIRDLVSEEQVVVVVDAERLLHGELDETFISQIEAADRVLLNKSDLVGAAELDQGEAKLREWVGERPIFRTLHSKIGMDDLFVGADLERRDAHAEVHAHSHERFITEELAFPGVVDLNAVIDRIRTAQVIRAKGFVRTPEGVMVIQGVGDRIETSPPAVEVDDALVGRVVLIRRIDGHDEHG